MKLLQLVALLGSLGCCFGALADVEAFVESPVGASITITATLSITTALGTSSDSDTKVVLTSGNAFARCAPDAPVFTNLSVTSLIIDPANVTFHFDLYCFPFIGCQALDVAVTEFSMVQVGTCASPIVNSVANCPSMQMALVGNFSTTGVATASGVLDGTVASSVATRVQALPKSRLKLDQLTLSPMTSDGLRNMLVRMFKARGVPKHIRSDNGPECIARTMRSFLKLAGIDALYIEPGSPLAEWNRGEF